MYYIGIDIGGMSIKIGVVSTTGEIINQTALVTEDIPAKALIEKVGVKINELLAQTGVSMGSVHGVGVGCPGAIDGKRGVVIYSSNLPRFQGFELKKHLEEVTGKPVRIANDADAATLGEVIFGSAKNYSSAIMLTIGTGIGGGIVIDKKLYEGSRGTAAELGHIVMRPHGLKCGCGRRGCFEKYASASALIRLTKQEMQKSPNSLMWKEVGGNIDSVNGKTSFVCAKLGDKPAIKVVNRFISYLGEGVLDYLNIFRPEVVVLGGGISKEGAYLTDRVKKYLEKYSYGYVGTPRAEIITATLGNDAGIVGAASLVAEEF
ncbi:MAG: ROK family protein [Clostridia bacterium]|nr:ROK family protein [Clostridia bacterium]